MLLASLLSFLILTVLLVFQVEGLYSTDHVLGTLTAKSGVPMFGKILAVAAFFGLFLVLGASYLGFWRKLSGNSVPFLVFRFLVVPFFGLTCIFRFNPTVLHDNITAIAILILLWANYIVAAPGVFRLTESAGIWDDPKNRKVFARYPPKTRGDMWVVDVVFFAAAIPFLLFSG